MFQKTRPYFCDGEALETSFDIGLLPHSPLPQSDHFDINSRIRCESEQGEVKFGTVLDLKLALIPNAPLSVFFNRTFKDAIEEQRARHMPNRIVLCWEEPGPRPIVATSLHTQIPGLKANLFATNTTQDPGRISGASPMKSAKKCKLEGCQKWKVIGSSFCQQHVAVSAVSTTLPSKKTAKPPVWTPALDILSATYHTHALSQEEKDQLKAPEFELQVCSLTCEWDDLEISEVAEGARIEIAPAVQYQADDDVMY